MKKTSSRSPTSLPNSSVNTVKNSNNKQPQNKSVYKLQNTNNNSSSVRNTTVRKSQNHISKPSVQKQKSSYFKRLEQSESHSSGSLSQQEAKELTQKFEALSKSIVELARSQSPLGVRSLESLLTREISGTFGPALNHPKFSQGFIQATRTLLDRLVSDYESGKVSPSLIRPDKNHILKADSSTTVCYRDKYFKELVISMLQLQGSCSNDGNEEINKNSVRNLSAESRERIQDIRNMVRAELGIKPEIFTELELRVAELRKSMSKSGIKTDSDLRAEARAIAEHLEYLKIPRSARDALRISCGGQISLSTEALRDTHDKTEKSKKSSSRINLGPGCTKNSLYDFRRSGFMDANDFVSSDGCKNKEIPVAMLIEDMGRIDPLDSYSRKFDIESAFDDDDDMINEEETRVFLEAYKADIQDRNRAGIIRNETKFCVDIMDDNAISNFEEHSNINSDVFLEKRDMEDCLVGKQTRDVNVPIKSFHNINNLQFCNPCLSIVEEMGSMGQDFNTGRIKNFKVQNLEITDLSTNTAIIDKVKSQFWLKESKLANEIIKEMQIEFEKFKLLTEDVFGELKAVASCVSLSNEQVLQSEALEEMFKYSVNDFAIILHKISEHIHILPITFDVRHPRFSECQKKQAFGIVSVLEKCFQINEHRSLSTNPDPLFPLNDTKKFTVSIKGVLLAFSNLAEIINQLPSEMKNMPISLLDPPETLLKTLAVLFSAEYFNDCFPPVVNNSPQQNDDYYKSNVLKSEQDLSINQPKPGNGRNLVGQTNRNIYMQTSSNKISSNITAGNTKNPHWFGNRNSNKPDASLKMGSSLGYSSSNITVENLSDMFLHISLLLNDVPKNLKAKTFMSFNPPDSLRQAISILYCSDDAEILTEYEKKKSFDSLTIQNTSDFFLTLSSTFHNVPERLKHLVVKDLDPPKSLSKAINLLSSLSNSSIQECLTQKNETIPEKVESQEHFFDAVDFLELTTINEFK